VDTYSYASLLYEITHGMFPFSKEVEEETMAKGAQDWFEATSRMTKEGLPSTLFFFCDMV
jgi:hypothetical protein